MLAHLLDSFLYRINKIVRWIKFSKLQKKYKFDKWHMIPTYGKRYVKDIISFANKNVKNASNGYIVEVGCGLCDIISKISCKNKMALDLSAEVCAAVKELYSDIDVRVGSFEQIEGLDIELLIAVNFAHDIEPDVLKKYYDDVISNNRVRYIIVDEVDGRYKYTHDYDNILVGYSMFSVLGSYSSDGGKRLVKVFCKET